MTDEELLIEVKRNIGITTDDTDINKSIRNKMLTAKLYLINGGAVFSELSELAIGCISIGVNDLLNNNAGETKFSPAFEMLARQICRG